jgi:hypothetical protein
MRRLGELWQEGNPAERAFVELLLKTLAHDGFVWARTWREGEELWEKTVQLQIDRGKPYPEVAAQFVLTALMTAESDIERLRPFLDP